MKKAVIIGAGFSGMCSAYFLNRAGYHVEIFEKEKTPGGLIKTVDTPYGACEVAANGILNSVLLEKMAKEIDLKLVPSLKSSRKRFIFRSGPKRWPLGFFETSTLIWKFLSSKDRSPLEQETVDHWGIRVLGRQATEYIMEPVLQGIYAGDIKVLSASLILKRFFKKTKKPKPLLKGIVSPESGMSQFFSTMEHYLRGKGVVFNYEKEVDLSCTQEGVIAIVATSCLASAKILKNESQLIFELLSSVEMLSIIKATFFYDNHFRKLKGFGILFPRRGGIRSLGVLFNSFIFPAPSYSESYILGGAQDLSAIDLSDGALVESIKRDRDVVLRDRSAFVGFHIKRWKQTLPHYTVTLEKKLGDLKSERERLERKGIFIIGNYLGGIGLSQLLEQASQLPSKIAGDQNV